MALFNALHDGLSTPIIGNYFGEYGDHAWTRAADYEATLQANQVPSYAAVEGCVWHPDLPDLNVNEERRREVLSGTLLVPTSLGLTLSVKDRWQDAADIVWKPQTISDDINGFRHLVLTRERGQSSGTAKR